MTWWSEGPNIPPVDLSLVCHCGGRKTYSARQCWKCAGQHRPSNTKDPTPTRALLALHRHWPGGTAVRVPVDDLLDWAATLSDDCLLEMRNFGPRGLAWLRSQRPDTPQLELDQTSYPWGAF